MYEALKRIDHKLVGWGWMLWDAAPLRARTADLTESLRLLEEARSYASDELLIANIELDLAYASSQVWEFERTATHVGRALELTPKLADDGLRERIVGKVGGQCRNNLLRECFVALVARVLGVVLPSFLGPLRISGVKTNQT